MPQLDKATEDRLVETFELALNSHAFPSSAGSIEQSVDSFDQILAQQYQRRPIWMQVAQYLYRRRLATARDRLKNTSSGDAHVLAALTEKVARLEFASRFGRSANSVERTWCHLEIQHRHIPEIDAPFLVWAGTINFKRRAIIYGHWDWIAGIFMMTPVMLGAAAILAVSFAPIASLAWKVTYVLSMTAATYIAFELYKSLSFDVFRVGRRYFKPRGLRYFI